MYETIRIKSDYIQLLDQRLLPDKIEYFNIRSINDAFIGIRNMIVRGAPAIGVTAAFGIAIALKKMESISLRNFTSLKEYLINSRPTAVNLIWALDKQESIYRQNLHEEPERLFRILFDSAVRMYEEDININKAIGENGQSLLPFNAVVITHCNAGALATCGWGTALGVIRSGKMKNKIKLVYADETRPYLQGSRLTAWELYQDGIPVKIITDSSSAYIMKTNKIDCAIVGADRIALNGDTANKIGTYLLAINCKYHDIPFYIAAPISTFDPDTANGNDIIIEQRDPEEIRKIQNIRIIPENIPAENPSFDITPNELITAYITEKGIVSNEQIKSLFK